VSNLPVTTLVRVDSTLTIEGASYEEVVEALRGGSAITFCSAAEDLSSGEKGKAFETDIRSAASRLIHLHMKVAKEADTMREMAQILTVVRLRDNLVPALKTYIDTGKRFEFNDFVAACEEWVRSQPGEVSCFKKPRPSFNTSVRSFGGSQPQNNQTLNKPKPTCFSCGKLGHMTRECRSRPPGEAVTTPGVRETPAVPSSSRSSVPKVHTDITCFRCNKKGHKSPHCPTRPKGNRRGQGPKRQTLRLQDEELFGKVNDCGLSITIDTGAQISIVCLECVQKEQMMGRTMKVRSFQGALVEGEACIVEFEFGGRKFEWEAVAVLGEMLNWTPCFQISFCVGDDLEYLRNLARERKETLGEQLYVQPTMRGKVLHTGYIVSSEEVEVDSTHIPSDTSPVVESGKFVKSNSSEDNSIEVAMKELAQIEIEGEGTESDSGEKDTRSSSNVEEVYGDHGSVEEAEREDGAYELDEVDGVLEGGCAEKDLAFKVVGCNMPREALAEATAGDDSLQLVKQLAEENRQGY